MLERTFRWLTSLQFCCCFLNLYVSISQFAITRVKYLICGIYEVKGSLFSSQLWKFKFSMGDPVAGWLSTLCDNGWAP